MGNTFHYGAFYIVQCYFRFVFWHVCGRKYSPYALAVGIGAVMVYLFACRTDAGMGAFNDGVPRHGACRRYCRFVRAYNGVFTRAFAQSFESIPQETIEALEATGVGRIGVFFNAVLPAALSQLVAWIAMRFEINFSECAILGMIGAGGIGFIIARSIQGYEYGTAGVAIVLVFAFAYSIERLFIFIKNKIR